MKRILLALALALCSLSGCYFEGREGFICKSTEECEPGLVCRTFSSGKDTRRACVPPRTTSIGSKSTYTTFAVYLAWFATAALPIGIAALVINELLRKKRAGGNP